MVQSGFYNIEVSRRGYFPVRVDSVRVSADSVSEITIVLHRDMSINEATLPDKSSIRARPNPFNSSCIIGGFDSIGEVDIFDIHGKLIKSISILETRTGSENAFEAVWNGTDYDGQRVSSGIYFANKPGSHAICRIMLIR